MFRSAQFLSGGVDSSTNVALDETCLVCTTPLQYLHHRVFTGFWAGRELPRRSVCAPGGGAVRLAATPRSRSPRPSALSYPCRDGVQHALTSLLVRSGLHSDALRVARGARRRYQGRAGRRVAATRCSAVTPSFPRLLETYNGKWSQLPAHAAAAPPGGPARRRARRRADRPGRRAAARRRGRAAVPRARRVVVLRLGEGAAVHRGGPAPDAAQGGSTTVAQYYRENRRAAGRTPTSASRCRTSSCATGCPSCC